MAQPIVLIVPIRSFDDAKSRLATALTATQRKALAMACAQRVIQRSASCICVVVCEDDEVEAWAIEHGAQCIRVASHGLNPSLTEAMPIILDKYQPSRVIIAHADLPFPEPLNDLIISAQESWTDEDVYLVTDHGNDGTNVLSLGMASASMWRFAYGAQSYTAHVQEAQRLHRRVHTIANDDLALDIDTPDDLRHPALREILRSLLPDYCSLGESHDKSQ